jgi:hypothetical protein
MDAMCCVHASNPHVVKIEETKGSSGWSVTVPVRRRDPEAEEAGHLHVRRRRRRLLLLRGGRRWFLCLAAAASAHHPNAGFNEPDHLRLLAILGNLSIANASAKVQNNLINCHCQTRASFIRAHQVSVTN